MDEAAALAALKHYMDSSDMDVAHEIYHQDVVLEFPQSGERFEGVDNIKAWRRIYPAKVDYELRRFRGRDDFWVGEAVITYDGGPPYYGVSILEFAATRSSTRRSTAARAGRHRTGAPRGGPPRPGRRQRRTRPRPGSRAGGAELRAHVRVALPKDLTAPGPRLALGVEGAPSRAGNPRSSTS